MKTITIYASTDSGGFVTGSSTDYSTARSTATSHHKAIAPATYLSETGIYKVMRSFLKFDTSVLGEAAIINAQLKMARGGQPYPVMDRTFTVQVVSHDWSGQDPITSLNRDDAFDGALSGTIEVDYDTYDPAEPPSVYAYSNLLDISRINTTTDTYYSLRSDRDKDNDEPPGNEYVYFCGPNAPYDYLKPALIINYYEPTTDIVDDIIDYILPVDWEGTQETTSWQDEAPRLRRFALDRGRDRTIGSPGRGFEVPQPGQLILELDNWDGRYDPYNASGPLYGKIEPGKRVNFAYFYNGLFYNIFTGFIEDIRMSGYRTTVTLTVKDGAGWLRDRSPEIALQQNQTVDSVIEKLLLDLGYPFGRTLDTGVNALPYYWATGTNALNEITDLAVSDMGRFCIDADGTAHFRSRNNADPVDHTLDESVLGKNIYFPMPWDYSRYVVDVYAYPRVAGTTDNTLWTLRSDVTVPADSTVYIRGTYTYENQRVPATGVYLDSQDPATLTLTVSAFSREAEIEIENTTSAAITLTSAVLKGTPIYSPDTVIVNEEADTKPTPAEFVYDYAWLGSVNTAQDYATILLDYLSTAKKYPEITIYNRPELACDIDLEQRVRLKLDTFGIDQTFFVNKISHKSGASMQEIITTVKLNPMLQSQDDDVLILDSATQGLLDTNKLGF